MRTAIAAVLILVRLLRVVACMPIAVPLLVLAAVVPAGKAGAFHPDWRGLFVDGAMSMLGFKEYVR